jgi:hypothetical protein
MPSNVKTEKDEFFWRKAKEVARKRGFSPKGNEADSFWAYTQAVYQRMQGSKKNESTIMEAAKDPR